MPPDETLQRAIARMDQTAATAVREQRQMVAAAPADPGTDGLAFESEAYRYAAEWLAAHPSDATTARPFALVLSRSVAQDEAMIRSCSTLQPVHYHAFGNQKMIEIQGCVVLTTMNFEHAIALNLGPITGTQALFNAIKTVGLQTRQIAAFEPAHANLILLGRGLAGSSRAQAVKPGQTTPALTLQQLEDEMRVFHNDHTRTPSGVLVPWSDASKGITGEKLELRISQALAYHLARLGQKSDVLAEASTPSGRIDIFITPPVLAPGLGPCVIEVKVFRGNRMKRGKGGKRAPAPMQNGHVDWWGKKGVVQADLYRKDKAAPTAYLCCFDARDKDADLPTLRVFAKSRDIRFERYFMYPSSGALQDAEMAANTKRLGEAEPR